MTTSIGYLRNFVLANCLLLPVSIAQAAISLDRTRIIFNEDQKSLSLNIRNDNKELPYLAQAWIENERNEKVSGPLMVLPPLQRVESGSGGQIKLQKTPEVSALPKDRESIFYFNLREIPPRSVEQNSMQIALQTKIKLFYRPAAITPKNGEIWQEKLIVSQSGNGLEVRNTTPFYITLVDVHATSDKKESDFTPIMLSPFSSHNLISSGAAVSDPTLTFVNDYGGYQKQAYACQHSTCTLIKK